MMNKVFDIGAICWQHCKVHIQSILKSPDNGYKFCLFIKLQTKKTEKTIDSKTLSSILIGQPSIVVIS